MPLKSKNTKTKTHQRFNEYIVGTYLIRPRSNGMRVAAIRMRDPMPDHMDLSDTLIVVAPNAMLARQSYRSQRFYKETESRK